MSEEKALKTREEIKEEYKWKLNKIFSSTEAWEEAFKKLKIEALKLKEFEGKLSNKEEILRYLKLNEEVCRLAEQLYVYAHMKSDEDTTNQKNQGVMNKIDAYMAEYATYTAYVVPEILSLPDGTIDYVIASDEVGESDTELKAKITNFFTEVQKYTTE